MPGTPVVGHGFYFAHICLESPLDEFFAVAGHAGTGNDSAFWQFAVEVGKNLSGTGQGRAFVAAVIFVKNASFLIQKHGLDGGGTGVDAKPQGPFGF